MNSNDMVKYFSNKIIVIEMEQNYNDYTELMSEITKTGESLKIIAGLASRLPTGAFKNFFLCNLTTFATFTTANYRYIYELCCDQMIALYNITLCLVVIGRIRGEKLRELCGDCSRVEKIEQFRGALRGDVVESEDDRFFMYYDKEFGISKKEIIDFRNSIRGF
jgi:hypothetical protein